MVLLATLVTMMPAPAAAQQSALLLGFGRGNPVTLLVEIRGDTVRMRTGDGIIVPRADGFWRVGIDAPPPSYPDMRLESIAYHQIDTTLTDSARLAAAEAAMKEEARDQEVEDSVESAKQSSGEQTTNAYGEPIGHEPCFARQLWAAPLGRWPVLATPECAEDTEWGGDAYLRFVGPTRVSAMLELTGEYSYGFDRGATLGALDSLAARGLSSMSGGVPGGPMLPRTPALQRSVRACDSRWIQTFLQQNPADYADYSPDFKGTFVHRLPGRWKIARYYALTSHAGRGAESTCDVSAAPRSITGWDSLTVPWKTITKQVSLAFDAFASPAGDVVVVLTPVSLVVRRKAGARLGATLATVPWTEIITPSYYMGPREAEDMTMSQWATGRNVERWSRQLAPVLDRVIRPARTVPTP